MGIIEMLEAIWKMPFLKALTVAALDDILVMLKLWPLWLALLIGSIIWGLTRRQ